MTNEEKAKSLWFNFCHENSCLNNLSCIECPKSKVHPQLIEMAEWKEQQMIDKAVEWLENNYSNYEQTYADVGGYISSDFNIDKMLIDFKQAMKRE